MTVFPGNGDTDPQVVAIFFINSVGFLRPQTTLNDVKVAKAKKIVCKN